MNNGCFNRQFLAFALLMMSVYALVIFVLYNVMQADTKPIVVVVTVAPTAQATEPPAQVVPGPPQSPATPPTAKHNPPAEQKGGYTGTTTETYTAPVAPVHYVVRTIAKHKAAPRRVVYHKILHKHKCHVYHHRKHCHRHKHHKRCHK